MLDKQMGIVYNTSRLFVLNAERDMQMELNLLPVMSYEGKKVPFELDVDLEDFVQDKFKIIGPVLIKGTVSNLGGCLELNAVCDAKLELVCDRCAESFMIDFPFELAESLRKADDSEGGNNVDSITFSGDSIELDEIVYDNLCLSMPTKVLCRDDCRGLCVKCGQNLNRGLCGCKEDTDPRFDVLDELL